MPIASIISQPAANSLNAAYRPIVFSVSAQNVTVGTTAFTTINTDFVAIGNYIYIYYPAISAGYYTSFFIPGFTYTVTGSGNNNRTFTVISTNLTTLGTQVFVKETVTQETGQNPTITRNVNVIPAPVVYCDVYFNNVYYRTLSKTQYDQTNSSTSSYSFDVEDLAQELLSKFIAANGGSTIVSANQLIKTTYCRFRSSTLDANGFISAEDVAPVQGTSASAPVAGTGTQSNTFTVVNAVLQHLSSQNLQTHLTSYKANSITAWSSLAFPLTHRPIIYHIGTNDSDYYPFIYTGSVAFTKIRIHYRNKGSLSFTQVDKVINISTSPGVYYLPNGTKNIASLFTAINWLTVDVYYLEVIDSANARVMSTGYNKVDLCTEETVRVHFLTYLGSFDAITFIKPSIVHDTTDSSFQSASKYPLSKTDFGIVRSGVRGNDTTTAITKSYSEDAMFWLQQLFDSPIIYQEWTGTEGQADDYTPVTLVNGKLDKLKNANQWEYITSVQCRLSNEYLTLRT